MHSAANQTAQTGGYCATPCRRRRWPARRQSTCHAVQHPDQQVRRYRTRDRQSWQVEKLDTQKIKGATINRHNRRQTRFGHQLGVNLARLSTRRKMEPQRQLLARRGSALQQPYLAAAGISRCSRPSLTGVGSAAAADPPWRAADISRCSRPSLTSGVGSAAAADPLWTAAGRCCSPA
jgi:hypothetical protein